MKKVYCDSCNVLVFQLEKGSKIRNDSGALCKECKDMLQSEILSVKEEKPSKNKNPFTEEDFNRIFGKIFRTK